MTVGPHAGRFRVARLLDRFGWLMLACALLSPLDLVAHHAIDAKFDRTREVTLEGVVTHVDWANPHVHVFVDLRSPAEIANWAVEFESRVDLEANGWRADALRIGERVRVDGWAARDGSLQAWANAMVSVDTGQAVFGIPDALPGVRSSAPGTTPRWPDGQPRLGPPPGETGYWGRPSRTVLVEDGVEVEMDAAGLLRDLSDAGRVAPMQPWAEALYASRQRDHLASDPMFLRCKPPGGPRQFQLPYGVQFVEQRDRERIFVLIGGGNRNWRFIYTDGRDQVGQVGGDDDNPLYYGRSVGVWDGDTLVVDTAGFNEDFWFTNGGLPHTDQLHLVERFTRTGLNTMVYEVRIDDPGAYTRPWSASWTLNWVAGRELPSYFCQDNRP